MMFTLILWTSFIFLLLIISTYLFSIKKYDYWQGKNVLHIKPLPIVGSFKDYFLFKTCSGNVVKNICEQFPDAPYIGAFYGSEPVLIVQNLELLKLVLTKDFSYFNGREVFDYSEREVVTQSLFFTHGEKWKLLRQSLSALFTTAKMKNMFYLIERYTHNFENLLDATTGSPKLVNVTNVFAAFTMDCIGSCSFGIEMNVMQNSCNSDFQKIGEMIFKKSILGGMKNIIRSIWPRVFYAFNSNCFQNLL